MLDLIEEFKNIRAIDDEIEVILIGFKKAYNLDNSDEGQHVTIKKIKNK